MRPRSRPGLRKYRRQPVRRSRQVPDLFQTQCPRYFVFSRSRRTEPTVQPCADRMRPDEAVVIATAVITRTEVAAALSRAQRDERMGAGEARRAEREFLEDWGDFGKVERESAPGVPARRIQHSQTMVAAGIASPSSPGCPARASRCSRLPAVRGGTPRCTAPRRAPANRRGGLHRRIDAAGTSPRPAGRVDRAEARMPECA